MTINDMTATARIRKALAHCRTVATIAAAEANGDCERTRELLEQRARQRRGYRRALLTLAIVVTADQAVETHLFGAFGEMLPASPNTLH